MWWGAGQEDEARRSPHSIHSLRCSCSGRLLGQLQLWRGASASASRSQGKGVSLAPGTWPPCSRSSLSPQVSGAGRCSRGERKGTGIYKRFLTGDPRGVALPTCTCLQCGNTPHLSPASEGFTGLGQGIPTWAGGCLGRDRWGRGACGVLAASRGSPAHAEAWEHGVVCHG